MPDTALMQFLLYLYNFNLYKNLYKSLRGYLQAYNIRTYKFATTSIYTKTVGRQFFSLLQIAFPAIIFHFPFYIFNFMPEPYAVTVQYRY